LQQLAEGKADIALLQKPWTYRGQVRGLTNSGGTIYSVAPEKNARSCIYVRNYINDLSLLKFRCRDSTTVRITFTHGGGSKESIVASAYRPYDSDELPPTKELREIIDYCHSRKKQLIVGCDDLCTQHIVRKHQHQSEREKPCGISGELETEYS
jgi:hypothetical protein